ncbi:MAG: helix-turn-helix transcriptional regulator [Nitrospirales bacterium]
MKGAVLSPEEFRAEFIHSLGWNWLVQFLPHKIFLWDKSGTYLACEFPNPLPHHCFEGPRLVGNTIEHMLPTNESVTVLSAIQKALETRHPTVVRITLATPSGGIQSLIRIFPMEDYAVGWVNDFPLKSLKTHGPKEMSGQLPSEFSLFTLREHQILKWIVASKANEEIANLLKVSERTVKFHVSNLLEKLQVSSRTHLKVLATLLLDP